MRVKKEIINSRCSFYRGVQAYYTEVSVTRESIILPASRRFSTHYSFLCVCMKKKLLSWFGWWWCFRLDSLYAVCRARGTSLLKHWTELRKHINRINYTLLNPLFILFSASGRKRLTSIFKLCSPLKTKENVTQLEYWLSETWVNLAMGKLLW